MPCASRSDGSAATVRSAVMEVTSSRRPVKTTRSATRRPRASACARSALPLGSLTDDGQPCAPDGDSRIEGIASIRCRWPFSASSRATTPMSGESPGMPSSRRRAHGCPGAPKRDRSTPLGMTANRAPWRPSDANLSRDAVGRHDQTVHRRRQRREERRVLRRPNARGVDGGHDDRRAGRHRRPRSEHLGAVHVGVDEVDLLAPQPSRELPDCEPRRRARRGHRRQRPAPAAAARRNPRPAKGHGRRSASGRDEGAARCSSPERRRCRRSPAAEGSWGVDCSGTVGSADGAYRRPRRWRPRGRARMPGAGEWGSRARCYG